MTFIFLFTSKGKFELLDEVPRQFSNASSPIDFEINTCDELRLITGQVGDSVGDVLRSAASTQRYCGYETSPVLLRVWLTKEQMCSKGN